MKKLLLTLYIFSILSVSTYAQVSDSILTLHPNFTASNYSLYQEPKNVKYTKAPVSYKPFYLSHYGRHGSRYHHNASDYEYLFETLAKADTLGKLTEVGKKVLAFTHVLYTIASPRYGDLSQIGIKQHEGIATRMSKNFAEIFKDRTVFIKNNKGIKKTKVTPHIKAYASTSGRCIVSMGAFIGKFRALNPKTEVNMVSGKSYMPFICTFDWNKIDYTKTKAYTDESDKLWQKVNPQPLLENLFNDSTYVTKNIDASTFYNRLFEITSQVPGLDKTIHSTIEKKSNVPVQFFYNLFTIEEKITRWKAQNSWWYSILGISPLIEKNNSIDSSKKILQNILDEADTIINADTLNTAMFDGETPVAATLRFGHDLGLLPLASLMQLHFANAKVSDLSTLHEQWNDFRIIPMAANLQIVFYKAKNKPILIKLLYNEIEQSLPIPCNPNSHKCPEAPFYRWDDFKNFYSKIAK